MDDETLVFKIKFRPNIAELFKKLDFSHNVLLKEKTKSFFELTDDFVIQIFPDKKTMYEQISLIDKLLKQMPEDLDISKLFADMGLKFEDKFNLDKENFIKFTIFIEPGNKNAKDEFVRFNETYIKSFETEKEHLNFYLNKDPENPSLTMECKTERGLYLHFFLLKERYLNNPKLKK